MIKNIDSIFVKKRYSWQIYIFAWESWCQGCCNTVVSIADEREAVQKKTFTKWVNSHLGRVTCRIGDLYTDLRDGRMLIRLLEVLSGEQLVSITLQHHTLSSTWPWSSAWPPNLHKLGGSKLMCFNSSSPSMTCLVFQFSFPSYCLYWTHLNYLIT